MAAIGFQVMDELKWSGWKGGFVKRRVGVFRIWKIVKKAKGAREDVEKMFISN